MNDDNVLEISMHIDAQPEIVFPYFTDPSRYVLWMGREATLDPRPGGTYRVRMNDNVEAAGEFIELDPPRRLVCYHAGGGKRRHQGRAAALQPARH